MKKSLILALLSVSILTGQNASSQEVYAVGSWENLFQWASVEGTPQAGNVISNPLR